MSFKEYKPILILCVFLGLVIGFVYVVSLYWPKYEEYFFELGLLGREGKAEIYFPDDNPIVKIGTSMSWQIYIHNHMGREQDVSIRIRILNSSMQAPDDREHEPSPEPSFWEIPVSLLVDETVLVPFSWSIWDAAYDNGTVVNGLIVNGEFVEVDVDSVPNSRFRIVFELWVYDEASDEYLFGWYSRDEFYSASLYMWFELHLHSF